MKEPNVPNPYFNLQWHLTNRCNLRCIHCYQDNYDEESVSLDRWEKVIGFFSKFCEKIKRVPSISFTGGEPFILGDRFLELLDFCDKEHPEIRKSIMTNGTLIKQSDIMFLKSIDIGHVQVSLDGASEETHDLIRGKGTFKKATDTLRELGNYGIRTAVMFVFHKLNFSEVPDLIDLCEDLGVSSLGITSLVPEGAASRIYDKLLSPIETKQGLCTNAELYQSRISATTSM